MQTQLQKEEFTKEEQEQIQNMQVYYPKYNIMHLRRNMNFYEQKKNDLFALATFPRSGSSLLLNIIEGITKHFCGEDMYEGISLESIAKGNVRATTDHCKVVRTHYPWLAKHPYRIKDDIKVVKAIYLVRNPFRNLTSLFSMLILNTHEANLPKSVYDERKEDFDQFIKIASEAYENTSKFWVEDAKTPVLVLRYEDLMANPKMFCRELFSFFENVEDIEQELPQLVEKIDDYFLNNGLRSTHLRGQKSGNDQYSYFSEEQKEYIYSKTKNWLKFFNYEEEVSENTVNIVDRNLAFDVKGCNDFKEFNMSTMANIKEYKNDKSVIMTYNDGDFEKRMVDPLIPMTKFA